MNRRVRLQPLRVAVYLPVRDRGGARVLHGEGVCVGIEHDDRGLAVAVVKDDVSADHRGAVHLELARGRPRGVVVRRNVPHRDVTRGTVDEESADDGEVRAGDGGVDVGGGHVPRGGVDSGAW